MTSQSTIEIVPLSPEYCQPAINLIISSFFLQEPLNARLKFDIPHEPLPWVDHVIDKSLQDQCSFVAIDTSTPYKEVVGVILNGISKREEKEDELTIPSEKLSFIMSLIDKVCQGYDLFQLFNTDRLFHCDIININENQRGKNLSTRLIERSLNKAKELKLSGAFVVCSSLFSRKAFMRHGFQVINELLYSEHGNGRLDDMGMHDRCTLLARKL